MNVDGTTLDTSKFIEQTSSKEKLYVKTKISVSQSEATVKFMKVGDTMLSALMHQNITTKVLVSV